MNKASDIYNQVTRLTSDLIGIGLCNNQTFPRRYEAKGICFVTLQGNDQAIALKNISYGEMYSTLLRSKNYNIEMLDGALIIIQYQFKKGQVIKHRLCYFPSPNLLEYQNAPELYEEDDMYSDIIDKRVVTVPLRFDFDIEAIDEKHPASHLTLGQYQNCRIPVSAPLTPYQFISFILSHFYNTPYRAYCGKISVFQDTFSDTITGLEKMAPHFRLLA